MRTLIFDIETVGEDWDSFDIVTQAGLTAWTLKTAKTDTEQAAFLATVKTGLGLSPLTGFIVSLAVYDLERSKGAVYYVGTGEETDETIGHYVFKQRTETAILQEFWEGAQDYDLFVTFNGRRFDVPFLLHRSIARNVRPTRELMTHRYLAHQSALYHIDLLDQLTFYGAMSRRPNLHLFCQAYGIPSPKTTEIRGELIQELFRNKQFRHIAQYNVDDVVAITELYKKWLTNLAPANFLHTVDL